jgi:hypothetical protein
MAFQSGTKVDPRLMQADYSGFANAASIRANALANLGQQIGDGIEKYKKNKEDKANEDGMVDFLVQTGAFGNATPEEIRKGVKGAGGGSKLLGMNKLIQDMTSASQMQEGRVKALELSNQSLEQQIGQRGSLFESQLSSAQTAASQAQENLSQSQATNPMLRKGIGLRNLQTEQATSIAANADARADVVADQGIASSIASMNQQEKAGLRADAQEARAATLAGQTQKERVQRMEIARSAEDRAVAAMYQRDPVSAKKLQSAQEYMDTNDLVFVDGQLYEKSGWFNGSATRVDNPSHLRIEGMQTLRDISINPEGAQGGNSALPPGYGVELLDGQASGTTEDSNAVTNAAIQNVSPSNPEGSRMGRFMRGIGGALDTGAQTMIQMGESAIASVPASAEYLFGEGDLSYSDAQQKYEDPMRRKRLNTPRSRALQGR